MSNSLWPHELQHARLPWHGQTPLCQWCHSMVSFAVIPFSICLQFSPASGSLPMSRQWVKNGTRWPKFWSFSIHPSKEYSGLISFRIDWFDLLSVQGLIRVFSSNTIQKHLFFCALPSSWSSSYIHTWLLATHSCLENAMDKGVWWAAVHGENHSFDYMDLCWQRDVSAF